MQFERFFKLLPRCCGHCYVWRHHPKCQTATLLEVENFEALSRWFQKSHQQTFGQFPWLTEDG